MLLDEFNTTPAGRLADALASCVPIPAWSTGILARRPYPSREELLDRAAELAERWTDEEVDGALAHHPRIGEKVRGDDAEARASRKEQGDLAEDEKARAEWLEANRRYEDRFDRIFLIRAAGRSPEEMMAELRRRLENVPETEAKERRAQLGEIAVLRLAALVTA